MGEFPGTGDAHTRLVEPFLVGCFHMQPLLVDLLTDGMELESHCSIAGSKNAEVLDGVSLPLTPYIFRNRQNLQLLRLQVRSGCNG